MTRRLTISALLTAALSLVPAGAAAASALRPESAPACPRGLGQVASHSGIRIDPGQAKATVELAIADGCEDVEVSLASYRVGHAGGEPDGKSSAARHEQQLFDVHTGRLSPGEVHVLTVAVDADCYHHVMLVLGEPVERFGPQHSWEHQRERTVESRLAGGPQPCAAPAPGLPATAPTSTTHPAAPTTTTTRPATPSTAAAASSPRTTGPAAAPPPTTAPPAASSAEAEAASGTPPTTAPAVDAVATPLVVAPPARDAGRLPFTGAGLVWLLSSGLVLLAGGVLLLLRSHAGSR